MTFIIPAIVAAVTFTAVYEALTHFVILKPWQKSND